MSPLQIADGELSRLVDEAADLAKTYWRSLRDRPAYPLTSGSDTARLFSRSWADAGVGPAVLQEFVTVADHSRPAGGRAFGYVFGSGEPVGAIGDLLASVLNPNVTAWRSAPAAATIEQTVVGWLADAVGCAGFAGSLCGGGSSANLMALAMAREAKQPANDRGARPCVVYASEQVHMAIPKAVALLGIGGRFALRALLCQSSDDRRRCPGDCCRGARGSWRDQRVRIIAAASPLYPRFVPGQAGMSPA